MLVEKGKAALNGSGREGTSPQLCRAMGLTLREVSVSGSTTPGGLIPEPRQPIWGRAPSPEISSPHQDMPNSLDLSTSAARQNAAVLAAPAAGDLGVLPEWDLSHLYPGIDSEPFRADLAKAEAECKAIAEAYRGKLEALAKGPNASAALGEAVKRFEAIEDLLGRIMSYAGLVYSGDTTDPARAKFYGDTQERLTAASSDLLFFGLELNRIDDAVMNEAMTSPPLAHYRPWIEDLRKDKPYQLDDQIEKLFHEKSVSGRSAWNRLFDETIASLRFTVRGEELPIEPTLNKLQDPDETVRKDAVRCARPDLQDQSAHLHADHQHAREGQGNLRSLARLRGCGGFPPPREPCRARGRGRSRRRCARGLSAPVAPLLRHQGQVVRQGQARLLGSQRATPESRAAHDLRGRKRGDTVLSAYSAFAPPMADIARRFFDERWIDAPTRPGKAPGAFAHPTVPSVHPYVLLNYQGKPRRRDDARPRARSRRPPGARGAQRRPDGADAADAGRDRLASSARCSPSDACSTRPRTRPSAKRCSPRRSRT